MEMMCGETIDLRVFDGGDGAVGAPAGATGAAGAPAAGQTGQAKTEGQVGQTSRTGEGKRRMRPGERKPPEAAGSDAGSGKQDAQGKQDDVGADGGKKQASPEERKAAFDAFIGEYKQEFSEYFNTRFNERYDSEIRTSRDRLAKLEPMVQLLAGRYGVEGADPDKVMQALDADEALWRDKAREAGMTVEQYREVERLKAANREQTAQLERARGEEQARRQYQAWMQEAEQLKQSYAGFDLASELGNEQFRRMLTSGFAMKNAYESLHHEELMQRAVTAARQETERTVTQNIQARGARPSENGTGAQRGTVTSADVHKMTRAQRREIARRLVAGEDVGF